MICERNRVALIDVALGAPASPELSRHLAECARCAGELERQRALLERIDGAIQAGVDVAASPGFRPRVRQLAAERRTPRRLFAWLLPVVAAAAMLAVGIRSWRTPAPPPLPPRVAEAPPSPAPVVEPVPPTPEPAPPARSTPPPRAASPRASEPEVLLRPGESEFLKRFAESARHQPVRAAVLLQAGFDSGSDEPAPLRGAPIQPLGQPREAIPPLDQPRVAIPPLAPSREEIRPLTIPSPEPRLGPGDPPSSERQ